MNENGSELLRLESPEEENKRLREENARLRGLLAAHSIAIPQLEPASPPAKAIEAAPPVDKEERARRRIALFRSLFRGREDVYARRWEREDGKSGYSPAAIKDWKAIHSSRPEDRKKVDQKTRKFLPLTDGVIENHLLGRETVGVYPLLPDETCWFLAADFDKKTWEYDSLTFLEICREMNVPAVLERSRSGKGGHIWIFFERPLPAITARKLGCLILTRAMERRHQLGLARGQYWHPTPPEPEVSVLVQHGHGIYTHRSARRETACRQGSDEQYDRSDRESRRIRRADTEQEP
jgi:hypothetical protein